VKKDLLTHGLFILGFVIITFIVHYPTFLSGKTLSQHDILQGKGGNQQLIEHRDETGEEALWNPNMFSGMPAYLTGVRYSGDLLVHIHKAYHLFMPRAAGILLASFLSFYIMMISFGTRPWIAFAAAVAFGLNGFNIIGVMAGHNAKIDAVAYLPLVIAGVHWAFSGKKLLGAGITALGLGLEIKANHPQITYYLVLIILAYGINELVKVIKTKEWKNFGLTSVLLIVAAILAVGANYGRLATTLEYSKYTIRGKSELSSAAKESSGLDKEYAFRYSNGITEPLFLFVPNFFGGSSQQELSTKSNVAEALRKAGYNRQQIAQQVKAIPTYWGSQPLTAPYYAGTITVVLFILGIVLIPNDKKIWLIVVAALGIIMSWGKNFEALNNLLFDFLPGYNKFRSVTFTIIMTMVAMNILGFMALEKLISTEWNKELKKKVFIGLGISIGFLVLITIFAGAFSYRGAIDAQLPDWFREAIRADRKSLLTKDALRALFFTAILIGFVWATITKKLKLEIALPLFAIAVSFDSFNLSRRFIKADNFVKNPVEDHFRMNNADRALLNQIKPGNRVLNLQNPFNENRTSYFTASIGGYHGAKIRRYQDLIDACIQDEIQTAIGNLRNQSLDFSKLNTLNMLNTKYLYAGTESNTVFENKFTNGSAWVITDVIGANSADEEIAAVCGLNTKIQAVIDQTKFSIPSTEGRGSITLKEKTPNKVTYDANITLGSATGVFSEIYYPHGWVATIDGVEAEILRANYVLRALEIPEGSHEIIFEFKPKVYNTGNTVMLISSILCILMFVGGIIKPDFGIS